MQFSAVHEHAGQLAVPTAGGLGGQSAAEGESWQQQGSGGTTPPSGDSGSSVVPVFAVGQARAGDRFELLEHSPATFVEPGAVDGDLPACA
jgi:hypothetical protein